MILHNKDFAVFLSRYIYAFFASNCYRLVSFLRSIEIGGLSKGGHFSPLIRRNQIDAHMTVWAEEGLGYLIPKT